MLPAPSRQSAEQVGLVAVTAQDIDLEQFQLGRQLAHGRAQPGGVVHQLMGDEAAMSYLVENGANFDTCCCGAQLFPSKLSC